MVQDRQYEHPSRGHLRRRKVLGASAVADLQVRIGLLRSIAKVGELLLVQSQQDGLLSRAWSPRREGPKYLFDENVRVIRVLGDYALSENARRLGKLPGVSWL